MDDQFDVFISYNWGTSPTFEQQQKVKKLYKFIAKDSNIKTWMDIHEMSTAQWLYTEIAKGITNSKVIVACITKAYSQSLNCQREISFAIDQKKPIIALMFENVTMADLGGVGFLITPLLRINLFENTNGTNRYFNEDEINNALLPDLKKLLKPATNQPAPTPPVEPFSNIHLIKKNENEVKFKNEKNKIFDFKYLEDDLVACVEQPSEGDPKRSLIVRKFDGTDQQVIDFVPTLMFFYSKQKLLLAASTEPEVLFWKTNNNYQKLSFKTDAPIKAFDKLDNDFLVTMSEKDVSLWKYKDNSFVLQKKFDCPVESEQFACIKALPENKLACGLVNSKIFILDVDLKQEISFKAHEKDLTCLSYTLIKDFLISLSVEDKRVKLWDYKKGECVGEIALEDNDYTIKDYLVIVAHRYIGVVYQEVWGNELSFYDTFDSNPIEIKRFYDHELHSDYFRGCEFIEEHRYCVLYSINDFSVIKFE